MSIKQLKCPNCGAGLTLLDNGEYKCNHCDTVFFNEDECVDKNKTVPEENNENIAVKNSNYYSTKKLCFVALFTAMNVVMSSFSIPVPGGHLYLCDAVICFAALILDPLSAFIVGGFGSFLGDLIFYPAPMFVSLITHGLQAVAISLIVGKKTEPAKLWRAIVAVLVGAIIMNVGYFLGRAYVYSTYEAAVVKIPYEILQAAVGAVVAIILLFFTRIKHFVNEIPKK